MVLSAPGLTGVGLLQIDIEPPGAIICSGIFVQAGSLNNPGYNPLNPDVPCPLSKELNQSG